MQFPRVFVSCSPPTDGRSYPSFRMALHVSRGDLLPRQLVDIIKASTAKYIFPGNLETYRVGDFYLIFNGMFILNSTLKFSSYNSERIHVFVQFTCIPVISNDLLRKIF